MGLHLFYSWVQISGLADCHFYIYCIVIIDLNIFLCMTVNTLILRHILISRH